MKRITPELKPHQIAIGSIFSIKRGLVWTCSNVAHHQHRWKWTAWICGRIQAAWNRRKP